MTVYKTLCTLKKTIWHGGMLPKRNSLYQHETFHQYKISTHNYYQ